MTKPPYKPIRPVDPAVLESIRRKMGEPKTAPEYKPKTAAEISRSPSSTVVAPSSPSSPPCPPKPDVSVSLRTAQGRLAVVERLLSQTDLIEDDSKRITESRQLVKLAHDISERIELTEENQKLVRAMEGSVVEIERGSLASQEATQVGREDN